MNNRTVYTNRKKIVRFIRSCFLEWYKHGNVGGFLLAVNIYDRYVTHLRQHAPESFKGHTTARARAVIAACMLIASKYTHTASLTVADVVQAVSDPLFSQDVVEPAVVVWTERDILNQLKFRIATPLADACLYAKHGVLQSWWAGDADRTTFRVCTDKDLTRARMLIELFSAHDLYPTLDVDVTATSAFLAAVSQTNKKRGAPCTKKLLQRFARALRMTSVHVDVAIAILESFREEPAEDRVASMAIPMGSDACCGAF